MADIQLSSRARRTPQSPIRLLSHLANAATSRGTHVYHLNIGQPDLPAPQSYFEGIRSYSEKVVAYDPSPGSPALREAWCEYANHTLNLDTTPEEYLITMGASEALVFMFMICCDPGDEVIVFDPTYANYIGFAATAGVNLIPVLSRLDDDFALPSREAITERLSPSTRAILLCSPNNPTGTCYTREQLQVLLDLCEEANLVLVVDETYRELVFDDRKPLSILHVDRHSPRVVVIDSLSKRFSLCGARIGTLHTPNPELRAKALNVAQARLAAPAVEQHAAAYMLRHLPEDYLETVRQTYAARRDVVYKRLCDMPNVDTNLSHGAFYNIARLPLEDAEDFSRFMLSDFSHNNRTVFLAPAAGFYMGYGRGLNKVRVAYVLNEHDLLDALDAFEAGLDAYKTRPVTE